jgi:hypothetical protein
MCTQNKWKTPLGTAFHRVFHLPPPAPHRLSVSVSKRETATRINLPYFGKWIQVSITHKSHAHVAGVMRGRRHVTIASTASPLRVCWPLRNTLHISLYMSVCLHVVNTKRWENMGPFVEEKTHIDNQMIHSRRIYGVEPEVIVQFLAFLLRIGEVPGSVLGPGACCYDWGNAWFSWVLLEAQCLKTGYDRFLSNSSLLLLLLLLR